ncbi:hypothetical protein M5K25_011351 [Dendrobium thyrsiflorum]|uniref:Transposase MuDR plant domain-containing protein n=1 Tax=Dendrobium thyrsiflorum TaxID=117978 RepID=A0ABD0V9K4_DENTH
MDLNNFCFIVFKFGGYWSAASDKSRVIATCKYRGCPWRMHASLCPDDHSFEVRKLYSTHLCPGVNQAGQKQATTSWVAHEIKDIVKKNLDITPKDINNNLETTFGLYKMAYDGAISTHSGKELWTIISNGELICYHIITVKG